jgi:hypothetical protein
MIRTEVSAATPPALFDPRTPVPVGQFQLSRHAFEVNAQGLFHHADGVLRAVVPSEGWDDYAALYPAALEAVEAHRRDVAAAAAAAGGQS